MTAFYVVIIYIIIFPFFYSSNYFMSTNPRNVIEYTLAL